MKIFAEKERTDLDPAWHAEAHYAYLDRSGRTEPNRVQSEIERWFSRCPSNHQERALKELTLNRDENFLGAWFEILLHELFVCSGAQTDFEPLVGASKLSLILQYYFPMGILLFSKRRQCLRTLPSAGPSAMSGSCSTL